MVWKPPLLKLLFTLGVLACAAAEQSSGISDSKSVAAKSKSAVAVKKAPDDNAPMTSAKPTSDSKPDSVLIFAALGSALIIAIFAFPRREK